MAARPGRTGQSVSRIATWRVLPPDGGSAGHHFRQSDALSRLAERPTLWWHWTHIPTLVIGAGQSRHEVDLEACARAGIEIVKRGSGGTAVYADSQLLGLDIALPPGHSLAGMDVVESYRWLGEAWLRALRLLGVNGRLVSIQEARALKHSRDRLDEILRLACFGSLAPYEVAVGNRKLVGLSQIRRGRRVLFQCGVYQRFDAALVTGLLRGSARAVATRQLDSLATSLHAASGRDIGRQEVMDAFLSALRDLFEVTGDAGTWTPAELAHIRQQNVEVQ